ncbi:unnamed protein product [Malus baccata var. baccata]
MAVKFRSGLGGARYDVLIVKDDCDRLRVKFVGFGDDHDEDYEGDSTTTNVSKKWAVKEVMKSNFPEFLEKDVLKMGMLTYSFSVQTSHMTFMFLCWSLTSPFLAQERGLDSADLISFLVELSFHVNGEAKNMVKDLADLGLIKLQQGRKDGLYLLT